MQLYAFRRTALYGCLALALTACTEPGVDASVSEAPIIADAAAQEVVASELLQSGTSNPAAEEVQPAERPRPPAPDPNLRIEVNLPAGRLDLYKDGALHKSYPVSVGYTPHTTPVGSFQMRRVIWNPWWHPPKSEWAAKRTKTAPGPRNPMGRAKLHLTELIYIHGTTSTSKLGRPASHGCIRMSNASVLELARIVAQHTGALETGTIDKLEGNATATREVSLPRPIAVQIRYERAEIRGDSLVVHRDIYGRAYDPMPSARRAWTGAGRDVALLTPEVLAAAVARGQPPKPAPPAASERPAPKLLGTPVIPPPPSPEPTDTLLAPSP